MTDLQSPFSLWFGGVRDNLVTIRLQQMTLDAAKIELFRVFDAYSIVFYEAAALVAIFCRHVQISINVIHVLEILT